MPRKILGTSTPYGIIVGTKKNGYYLVEGPPGITKRIEASILFPEKKHA